MKFDDFSFNYFNHHHHHHHHTIYKKHINYYYIVPIMVTGIVFAFKTNESEDGQLIKEIPDDLQVEIVGSTII